MAAWLSEWIYFVDALKPSAVPTLKSLVRIFAPLPGLPWRTLCEALRVGGEPVKFQVGKTGEFCKSPLRDSL